MKKTTLMFKLRHVTQRLQVFGKFLVEEPGDIVPFLQSVCSHDWRIFYHLLLPHLHLVLKNI